MNKKIILFAGIALSLGLGGCEKNYLDINENPNSATESNVTAELIFPNGADGVGRRVASANYRFLNNWIGYWAASGSFARDQEETTYDIDFSFGDALWQNTYNTLFDLDQAKEKALASGDTVLAAASMILSDKLFMDLVDVYGNIPYSQAFKTSRPAYDKDADVYTGLQANLDQAITYMLTKAARTTFTKTDIVNGGNKTLWVKFANTLKLKMLIHQAEKPGFAPTAEIAKIVANGGVLHAGETISVNPGYANETGKQSPYYANFGLSPTGTDNNTVARANQYFVTILTSNTDPRINRFFKAPSAGGSVHGNVYGDTPDNLNDPNGSISSNIGLGLAGSATQRQWIQTAFESMFLEAEAIARGWITGNAQTAYQAAVTENFTYLGLTAAQATTYYTSASTAANYTTGSGSTVASRVKFIVFQKYIANAGFDPLESWCDIRRIPSLLPAGYISVNTQRVSNTIPIRLKYPQSEYSYNSANVQAQGSVNQFTTKIFWIP